MQKVTVIQWFYSTCQQVVAGKPIFFFDNTGNVYLNISIEWKTGNTPDGCIDMCANATCFSAGCDGANFSTGCINITSTDSQLIGNLSHISSEDVQANVTLYADFTSCTTSLDHVGQLNHHSVAAPQT